MTSPKIPEPFCYVPEYIKALKVRNEDLMMLMMLKCGLYHWHHGVLASHVQGFCATLSTVHACERVGGMRTPTYSKGMAPLTTRAQVGVAHF